MNMAVMGAQCAFIYVSTVVCVDQLVSRQTEAIIATRCVCAVLGTLVETGA